MSLAKQNNIKIVIAGPGAGKTYDMIGEIIKALPEINRNPHRICTVITYTNAATEEIRERLGKEITIPNNIFIGTTHSFLIKYLIEPYSNIFLDITESKSYIDGILLPYKPLNKFVKKNQEIKLASSFVSKGIITYDKVIDLSFELAKEAIIIKKLSYRISHLFVDEYQDIHTYQHEVLMKIINDGKTKFYCVGDPLQSIYKFYYIVSQIKLKKGYQIEVLNDSPILKLKSNLPDSIKEININHRSTPSITSLISKYTHHIEYNQKPAVKIDYPICLIESTNKKEICENFYAIQANLKIPFESETIKYLHLTEEWKFWDDVRSDLKISIIQKGNYRNSSLFSEIKRTILGIVGKTQKDVLDLIEDKTKEQQLIQFRKFCIKVYKVIRNLSEDAAALKIKSLFREEFNYQFSTNWNEPYRNTNLSNSIKELLRAEPQQAFSSHDKYYSSIHSSKGLEATCVLVCAKTKNQLFTWLNFKNVLAKGDETRLGFVAFSRTRRLLCIACLEKLDDSDITKVKEIGFVLSNEILNSIPIASA
ncbi:MAG: UvrD-helicase domain-containing protein [Planctomycetia bacterium]|nr:UvrD-helicase domain-containing protein [Planctomycetia bacterium]